MDPVPTAQLSLEEIAYQLEELGKIMHLLPPGEVSRRIDILKAAQQPYKTLLESPTVDYLDVPDTHLEPSTSAPYMKLPRPDYVRDTCDTSNFVCSPYVCLFPCTFPQ